MEHNHMRFTKPIPTLAVVACLLAAIPASLCAQQSPPAEGDEAALIAVLESESPVFDKAKACQQLAVIGTKNAVPVLTKLLSDEQMSHYARFGLEPIPDPSVDEALRASLDKLKGGMLVGVINSIGMRRDAKAIGDLKGLMGDSDSAVAAAAAGALGRIATPEAVAILTDALGGPESSRTALADACQTAADTLIAAGKQVEAATIYDAMCKADLAKHHQIAALHGAIRARGADGMLLLLECFGSEDKALFRVALRMAHEIGGPEVAKTVMQALELPAASEISADEVVIKEAEYGAGDKQADVTQQVIAAVRSGTPIEVSNSLAGDPAPGVVKQLRVVFVKGGQEQTVVVPEKEQFSLEGSMSQHPRQVLLIYTLGDLGQESALPVILEAANSNAWDIRRAAIGVLGSLGDASAVPVLLATVVDDSGLAQAAFDSLRRLKGQDVDAAVAKALDGAEGAKRVTLIRLAGERGIASAVPALKQAADDADSEVALAAIHALGTTVGLDDLPVLIDRLVDPDSSDEGAAAKEALKKAVLRMPDRDACATALLARQSAASATAKSDLLELMGVVGGKKALDGVSAAAKSGSEEIQDAATRVLGGWMSPDAAPVLLELAQKGSDKFKVRTLRGYIRIIRQFGLPDDQRLAMCETAMDVATRDDERRLVLDALTRVPSAATMNMIVPHLENPGLKEAAAAATVAIAEKLLDSNPAVVVEVMEKAVEATSNDELAKRARSLRNRARRNLQ